MADPETEYVPTLEAPRGKVAVQDPDERRRAPLLGSSRQRPSRGRGASSNFTCNTKVKQFFSLGRA